MKWQSCYSCRDYADVKKDKLAGPLAAKARREDRDVIEVVDEFMLAAHERHMTGEPLYPGGPTRVTDPMMGRLAALLSSGLFTQEPVVRFCTFAPSRTCAEVAERGSGHCCRAYDEYESEARRLRTPEQRQRDDEAFS